MFIQYIAFSIIWKCRQSLIKWCWKQYIRWTLQISIDVWNYYSVNNMNFGFCRCWVAEKGRCVMESISGPKRGQKWDKFWEIWGMGRKGTSENVGGEANNDDFWHGFVSITYIMKCILCLCLTVSAVTLVGLVLVSSCWNHTRYVI